MPDARRPAEAVTSRRIEGLDGLRGVAVLLIVLGHSSRVSLMRSAPTAFDESYFHLVFMTWSGVDLFFVLSGFLITGILLRNRDSDTYFRSFYARRSLRIFPLYYAFLLFVTLVLGRGDLEGQAWTAHLLYVQNYWYWLYPEDVTDGVLGPTWSLAVEEQFYLLWPLVLWFTPRRRVALVCVLFALGATALRIGLVESGVLRVSGWMPCRMDSLCFGGLLAAVPLVGVWRWRLLGVVGVGLLLWASLAFAPFLNAPGMTQYGLLGTTLAAGAAVVLAQRRGLFGRLCRLRLLEVFGKYSYAIYLTHWLVIDVVERWLLAPGPFVHMLDAIGSNAVASLCFWVVCSFASLLVAVACWHLLERHFLTLKRWFPSRGSVPEA